MIDWSSNFFTLSYWFSPQPGPLMNSAAQFLLIVFGLCLIGAIIFYSIARIKKDDPVIFKLYSKIKNLFTTLAVVGFIILFFFWQQVPYLSSRFWVVIWLLILLIWAGFIGRFGFFEAPKRKEEIKKKRKFEKYLPKKKQKKKKK